MLTSHRRHINLDSRLCHWSDSIEPFVDQSVPTLGYTVSGSGLGYCYHMHISRRILQSAVRSEISGGLLRVSLPASVEHAAELTPSA
jgi:hypothetical protein